MESAFSAAEGFEVGGGFELLCEWGQVSPIHSNLPNISALASIHQLHQLFTSDIPIRLRRMESAFSTAEGFERGGGFELR